MKKQLVIVILLLFVSSAAGQNWFDGTYDEALTKAKSDNKTLLIDFFGDN